MKRMIICLLMLVAGITAWAETLSGKCGENVSYTLTDGVLTLTGSGPMEDFEYINYKLNCPWRDYYADITKVEVGEGITRVGNNGLAWLTNPDLTISLPSTLQSLGDDALHGCDGLKTLVLPAALKSIGASCFEKCVSLDVELPGGLETIGQKAFKSCESLKNVVLPNSLTEMGREAFNECYELTSVTMGDGLQTVPVLAFGGCLKLEKVVGKGKYVSIQANAFSSCDNLSQFELSDNLETIGQYILWGNKALTSLTIPNSVTTLDKYALHAINAIKTLHIGSGLTDFHTPILNSCWGLEEITVDEANPALGAKDGVLYTHDLKTLLYYPPSKPGEVFYVPDGVTTIGMQTDADYSSLSVFDYAKELKKIVFSNTVETYNSYLFYYMNNRLLEEVVLGSGTKTLGVGAFSGITPSGSTLKSIVCKATTVPEALSSTFTKNTRINLYVPASALAAYQADENWNKFNLYSYKFSVNIPEADAHGNYLYTSYPTSYGNESISLVAVLSEGYEVETITVTDENGNVLPVTGGAGWWSFDMPEADVNVSVTFKQKEGSGQEETKDLYTYWSLADTDNLVEGDYLIAADLTLFYNDNRGTYAFCVPDNNIMDWCVADVEFDGQLAAPIKNTFHITPTKGGYYIQLPDGRYLCPDDKAYNGASASNDPVVLSITKSGKYVTITEGSHELKTYSKTYGFTPGYVDNLEQQQGLWTLFVRSSSDEFDPVGIQALTAPTRSTDVYDLSGRRTTSTRAGIYIKDGKKLLK